MATDPAGQAAIGIALSRCYRETGSFAKAIESGEAILARLAARGQAGLEDHIRLTVTVAMAYRRAGDVGTAVRLCRRAVRAAEEMDSADAKAAAYWNSSIMERASGNLADAMRLATNALKIHELGSGNRSLARLRTWVGQLSLMMQPPDAESALRHLRARRPRAGVGGGLARRRGPQPDLAGTGTCGARRLRRGSQRASRRSRRRSSCRRCPIRLMAAEMHIVQAQAYVATGDLRSAATSCERAAQTLELAGTERDAAQLWFELGDVLDSLGDLAASYAAYRRSAALAGIDWIVPALRERITSKA